MECKNMLKRIGGFFVLCVALLFSLPDISVWAKEAGTLEMSYELEFTPGTGLPAELDKGNTNYAYLDLAKRANGESKQELYQVLEEIADSFWGCTDSLTLEEGEKNTLLATIQTTKFNLSFDELTEVYYMFKNDHPVFYFLSESVTLTETEMQIMTGVANFADRELVEGELVRYLNLYASYVDDTSVYATAKAFHDELIGMLEYSYEVDGVTPEDAHWAHSIFGAVCLNQGVCETYAKTYQMLLNYYGIENVYVTGVAGSENHAWNLVKLDDGLYYCVDATWNDTSYSEQYFACGENIMAASHTPNLPTGIGVAFLYELPGVSFDGYIKSISVYKENELLGKAEDISSAFRYCTDVNGTYKFSLDREIGFILPTGEWPEVKEIELCYNTREENGGYYIMQLCLVGDTYINSDVVFRNIGIYGDKSLGEEGLPTLHARNYTLRFEGMGNCVGTYYEDQGCRIYGPEATIITNAEDKLEVYFSDIVLGSVYLRGTPWITMRCGDFTCGDLYVTRYCTGLYIYRFGNNALNIDIGTIHIEDESCNIQCNALPNSECILKIGNIVYEDKTEEDQGLLNLYCWTNSRKKIPLWEIGNSEVEINIEMEYYQLEGYTETKVLDAMQTCEDAILCSYYDRLLDELMYEEYDSDGDVQNIFEYEAPFLNIGITNPELLSFRCDVFGAENTGNSFDKDFTDIDADGNVRRVRDEVMEVTDGVLTKVKMFSVDKTTLIVPESAESIANFKLSDCIDKVIIHSGVRYIEDGILSNDSFAALTYNRVSEFVVDENNACFIDVDGVLYTKEMDRLVAFPISRKGDFILPETVKVISRGVFANKNLSLEKLVIPSSVESISAFELEGNNCEKIEVDCGEVYFRAFGDTKSLKCLTFGLNVNYIGERVLEGSNVKEVYILNPYVELFKNAFANILNDSVIIYGYAGSTAEEYVATYGEEYGLVFSALPTPSDPITDFVTRMYRIILEREPDAGSSTWINGLKDGSMTGVRVADGFVLSEEMLNKDISNEEFVKILYRAFFGREADADGLATWKGLLDAGCKKTYVFAGFANSTEFGTLCAEAGIVQGRAAEYLADRQTGLSEADYKVWCFVERMYMEVLNRTADEPGVRSWVGALQDGSMTGVQVADGFIMSDEFLAKNMTNEEYVRIMYRAFFGRDADAEGLATWTNALATGWTKKEVFAGFANSNEFGVLCEEAGIIQGK